MTRYTSTLGALCSGLCLFFAVQYAVFVLAWIALVPLLVIIFRPNAAPFRAGFLMGVGLSVCGFYWMIPGAHAFTGASVVYGILIFVVCVLVFSLGCACMLWLMFRLTHPLYIASMWVLAETVLQWAAGSMPWFLFHIGNALSANLTAIQPASVIGVTGLSFVVVLVNCLIAQAIVQRNWKKGWLPLALFLVYMGCGWWLLVSFEQSVRSSVPVPGGSHSFKLAILAENIPPETQWDPINGNALVQQLLQQEGLCIAQSPNLILWPESAIPWTYSPDDDLVRELLRQSDPARITHVLGMNTGVTDMIAGNVPATNKAVGNMAIIDKVDRTSSVTDSVVGNSAYCLLPGGRLAGRYDKRVPLLLIERTWHGLLLPFFSANGYSVMPGKSNLPLPTPYGKAGILICNESALPEAAASTVSRGAQFLLNIGNDGWFRSSYLVSSHFYNARLRAVETRKDLAINSNNGRSGLVDASGRIDDADLVTIHPNSIQTIAVRCPLLALYISLFFLLISLIIHQKTKSP